MTEDQSSRRLFDNLAEITRTLGHAHRLMLLEHISQGERSVERLAELTGLSMANASQHLQHLRRGGFVDTRREGKRVLYRLGGGPVIEVLTSLRAYAEHGRTEVAELLSDPTNRNGRLDSITNEDLLERLANRSVTLLDVRTGEEFALGHLPGARNIPTDELGSRLTELPTGKDIVAYCRGPYCVLSTTAADFLRTKGFNVLTLESGFPEWKAAGLEIEA